MFVVRRRAGEKIIIAGTIEVEILEISRTRVKLGISAPVDVPVRRVEALPVAADNLAASAWVAVQGSTQPAPLTALLHNLRHKSIQAQT